MPWNGHWKLPMQDILRNLKETKHSLLHWNQTFLYIYISYRYNIKHFYNIQIQTEYIANKKIIQNYAQMKYKWPVTAIKPLKNKLFSVTSNPSTLVYFMSSMIQFHSWLNLLTAARLNQTWFKKYFPVSLSTIYNIKREDITLEILYSSTIKR